MMKIIPFICLITHIISPLIASETWVISMVDRSGSMVKMKTWLKEYHKRFERLDSYLKNKDQHLQHSLVEFGSTAQIYNNGEGATFSTNHLEHAAIRHQSLGGTEDAYLAVEKMLSLISDSHFSGPIHAILIADEKRTPLTHSSYEHLLRELHKHHVTLHAIVPKKLELFCDEHHSDLIAIEGLDALQANKNGETFHAKKLRVIKESDTNDALSDINHPYAKLALATGGSVWDARILFSAPTNTRTPRPRGPLFNARTFTMKDLNGSKAMTLFNEAFEAMLHRHLAPNINLTTIGVFQIDPNFRHHYDGLVGQVIELNATGIRHSQDHAPQLNFEWDSDGDGLSDSYGSTTQLYLEQEGQIQIDLKFTDDQYPPHGGNLLLHIDVRKE